MNTNKGSFKKKTNPQELSPLDYQMLISKQQNNQDGIIILLGIHQMEKYITKVVKMEDLMVHFLKMETSLDME
jgi:hypothetical protein